jgi:hypothetical protein
MASNLGIALTGIISSSATRAGILYVTNRENQTSLSTYTFTNVQLEGAGLCVVNVQAEVASTARIVNSVTIGGLAATEAAQVNSAQNVTATTSAIFYLANNANTSADIVVTFNTAPARCFISVYKITKNSSNTPFQTLTNTATSGTGLSLDFTALSAGAVGVAIETIGTDSVTSVSWTNATLNYNQRVGAAGTTRVTGASFTTSSSGNRTVSVSHSNSTQPLAMAGAVWV